MRARITGTGLLAAALVALGLALSGCSSNGDSSTTTTAGNNAGTGVGTGTGTGSQTSQITAFRTLMRGDNGGSFTTSTQREVILITSQSDWDSLWAQHTSIMGTPNPPPPPTVDFQNESLVAYFMGSHTSNVSVQVIEAAVDGSGGATLRVEEEVVGGGQPAGSLFNPFHIVAVAEPGLTSVGVQNIDEQPFDEIARGGTSQYNYTDPSFTDIEVQLHTDAQSWASLWSQHDPTGAAAPTVDFSRHSVVAAFMGNRQSGGYAIDVLRVYYGATASEIVVHVGLQSPSGPATSALTNPYHFGTIPAVPAGTGVRVVVRTLASFSVIAQGQFSDYQFQPSFTGAEIIERTDTAFQSLWQQHDPATPAPTVGFPQEMVLAGFLGYRTTGGYSIGITRIVDGPGVGDIEVEVLRTSPTGFATQVITNPFVMVSTASQPGLVLFR